MHSRYPNSIGVVAFSLLLLFFPSTQGFGGLTTTFKVFPSKLPCCSSWYSMNISGTPNSGVVVTLNGSSDIVFAFFNSIGNVTVPAGSVNLTLYVLQNNASYRVLVSTPSTYLGDLFSNIWLNFTVNPVVGWNKIVFNLPQRTILKGMFLIIDIIRTTVGTTKFLLGNSTYPATLTLDPEWEVSQPIQTSTFGDFAWPLVAMWGILWGAITIMYREELRVRRRAE